MNSVSAAEGRRESNKEYDERKNHISMNFAYPKEREVRDIGKWRKKHSQVNFVGVSEGKRNSNIMYHEKENRDVIS